MCAHLPRPLWLDFACCQSLGAPSQVTCTECKVVKVRFAIRYEQFITHNFYRISGLCAAFFYFSSSSSSSLHRRLRRRWRRQWRHLLSNGNSTQSSVYASDASFCANKIWIEATAKICIQKIFSLDRHIRVCFDDINFNYYFLSFFSVVLFR